MKYHGTVKEVSLLYSRIAELEDQSEEAWHGAIAWFAGKVAGIDPDQTAEEGYKEWKRRRGE